MNVEKIVTITDDTYHYTSGYYTMNKWSRSGDLILMRSVDMSMRNGVDPVQVVRYSVTEKRITDVICDDLDGNYIIYDNMMYYCTKKTFKSINLDTLEQKNIYEFTDLHFEMPHITNDGRYVSLEGHKSDSEDVFLLFDLETGEVRTVFKKAFLPPFQTANHGMVCPENPDIIFFSHEGTTQYITNRMWIYDSKNENMRNLVNQKMTEKMDLGEYYGHEMWAPDGKGLYFVKFPQSPIKPTGLCYADLKTGEKQVLFSKYAYWHVSVSKNGKYLLADTMRGVFDGTDLSEVVLADIENKTEKVIDVVHSTGSHPCHPHPIASPDSKKVVYTSLENGKMIAKVAVLCV